MKYEVDPGPAARLGLVVLSTDETLEDEARQILGPTVSLYHSRIECAPDVTTDNLRKMEARMTASAELLPEGLDAIGYGCTSASVVIGGELDRLGDDARAEGRHVDAHGLGHAPDIYGWVERARHALDHHGRLARMLGLGGDLHAAA